MRARTLGGETVRRVHAAATGMGRGTRTVWRAVRRPLLVTARTLLIAVSIGGLVLGAGWTLLHRVPPGTIGVRQATWGGRGVVERDFGPGLHWAVAGKDAWHHLPAGSEIVHFAWETEGGTHPMLDIATREGEAGQAAVLIVYRIRAGEAWQMVRDGLRADYANRAVAICRRVLLEELAALTATEFADPDARKRVETQALARLDVELGATHLEPLDVRIGSVFLNPTYEKKMLEKQLAAQDELTRASIAARKEEQRENDRVLARLEESEAEIVAEKDAEMESLRDANSVAVAALERDAKRYRSEILSKADIDELRLRNEGELALAAAEELRRQLLDEAMQNGAGNLYIARQAAENLRFGKVTLDSSDPRVPSVLDLDELVALLMGASDE